MNKEYCYVNGCAVIKNENDEKRIIDYCDNIDNKLVTENVIERLENERDCISKESKEYKKVKEYSKWCMISYTFILFASLILTYFVSYLFGNSINSAIAKDLFSSLNIDYISKVALATDMIVAPILSCPIIYNFIKFKKASKQINNLSELHINLTKMIIDNKKKLEKINHSSRFVTTLDTSYKRVNDSEEIARIDDYIDSYNVKKKVLKR